MRVAFYQNGLFLGPENQKEWDFLRSAGNMLIEANFLKGIDVLPVRFVDPSDDQSIIGIDETT